MARQIRRRVVGDGAVANEVYIAEQAPVVATNVPVHHVVEERRVVTRRRFDPAAVLVVAFGIFLGVVGAVAIARAGFEGRMDDPIVQVAGFTHTTVLGLIEVGVALLLVWAGLSRDRSAMIFMSVLLGAAALVAAIEPTVGGATLSIERSWAVLIVVVCAVLALLAALSPTMFRTSDRVELL